MYAMQPTNTILEDISAEIGFTATSSLCGWFGGRVLRIPKSVTPNHPIAAVAGQRQFEILVEAFGGTTIFIPKDRHQRKLRRDRIVFDMLHRGESISAISARVGISKPHIANLRVVFEQAGLLPMILGEKDVSRP
jgi:AraC-like DNA-binding protein